MHRRSLHVAASFRCARRERVAKPVERDFAFPSVIYHWEWIIRDQLLGGRFSESRRINILEFRHPPLDVVALRIVGFRLRPGILNPEIGSCVCAGASAPLPAAIVRSDIAV